MFSDVYANSTDQEYQIIVRDSYGCTGTVNVTMSQPDLLEFTGSTLVANMACDTLTETYQLSVTGGTGAYTYYMYASDYNLDNSITEVESNTTGEFSFAGTMYFRVVDDNGCEDTYVINGADVPEAVSFEIEYTDTPLCNGESGGFVSLVSTSLTGGTGDYVAEVYEVGTTTVATYTQLSDFAFSELAAGTYTYEVVSGTGDGTCTFSIDFEIEEYDELTLETIDIVGIGCAGDSDGVVYLKVNEGLGTGPFVYAIQHEDDTLPTFITVDTDTEEATFDTLSTGDYTYYIIDNGTGCNGPSGTFTIDDKDEFIVTYDEDASTDVVCADDDNGERVYNLSGGTAPYYVVFLDNDSEDELEPEDVVGNATYLVTGSDVAGIETTGITYTTGAILEAGVSYRIFFYDSGNGLLTDTDTDNDDDYESCESTEFAFEFNVEDLDSYTINATPDCATSTYTVTVDNENEDLDDDELLMLIYYRNADGSDGDAVGTIDADDNLTYTGVPSGEFNVYVESLTTGCTTSEDGILSLVLDPFQSVQFVTQDDNGVEVQPFVATNNINVYQLQVTGGVNPEASDAYVYTGTYLGSNGASSGTIDIDDEGYFTISETGYYSFKVIDNYGDDGETCFDEIYNLGINHLDIDIPNVFNPGSSDPLMNSWYPENVTSAFGGGTTPVDGDVELPSIVTATGTIIEDGITEGGTTTGGYTEGGNITDYSEEVSVESFTDISAETTGTEVIITVGGITEGGVTTGATTVVITIIGSEIQVVLYENSTISGGTDDGNVITGGTIVSGDAIMIEGEDSSDSTIYSLTIGGTTTGGVTTGGTTTGGTSVYNTADANNPLGSYSNMVTTDGTTTGGVTTGGTTVGGTTINIEHFVSGALDIDYYTETTVEGGETSGDTTTIGGTTTGGELISAEDTTIELLEFIDYANMEVFVFDRYGRLLERFSGPKDKTTGNTGWDGTYQGNAMPSGDYWYLVKLNDSAGREFTGHFTLYRK